MSCSACYESKIAECTGTIEVLAGLAASTSYKVRITDKFGNQYFQDVVTNGAGNFDLDFDDFESGIFTRHSGAFIMVVLNASGETTTLILNETEYTCVSISFYNSDVPPVYMNQSIPSASDEEENPVAAAFIVQQMEYTAAENIAAFEVITSEFKVGNSATVADVNKQLALSVTTTTNGTKGLAVVNGLVINPAWTWTIDADIYLNGTSLSETAPTTGFAVVIGKASRADAIVVNIGNPTLL